MSSISGRRDPESQAGRIPAVVGRPDVGYVPPSFEVLLVLVGTGVINYECFVWGDRLAKHRVHRVFKDARTVERHNDRGDGSAVEVDSSCRCGTAPIGCTHIQRLQPNTCSPPCGGRLAKGTIPTIARSIPSSDQCERRSSNTDPEGAWGSEPSSSRHEGGFTLDFGSVKVRTLLWRVKNTMGGPSRQLYRDFLDSLNPALPTLPGLTSGPMIGVSGVHLARGSRRPA